MFVSPKIALHYPGWQLKIHNWNFILFLNFFFPLDVKHISENISMGSIFDVPFFCCSRLHHIFLQPWEYFSLKVFFRQFFFSLEFLHLIEHFESHKCHSSLYVHEKTAHTHNIELTQMRILLTISIAKFFHYRPIHEWILPIENNWCLLQK